jgi:hypothetical protein
MKNLADILRAGDPAADSEMSPRQVDAMRRVVLDAARRPDVVRTPWQQPLAVAAMVALTIAAGIMAGRRMPVAEVRPEIDPTQAAPADQRRQLQFSTPGGTRIIWVFDPEFTLKETVP